MRDLDWMLLMAWAGTSVLVGLAIRQEWRNWQWKKKKMNKILGGWKE